MLTQNGTAAAEQCFTVTFTGTATEGIDFSTEDDSADAGTQICVAPGDTTGDITLTSIADAEFEGIGFETVTASSGGQTAEARITDANEPLIIPTLNAWGLGILAGLMAWLGFRRRL